MTYSAHYAMLLFAQRKTGIPEVDSARVQRILVPREIGKTTCITKARSIQRILNNPNHRIGIANETMLLAKGFLSEIKDIFEQNELIRTLFPEIIPKNFHDTIWAADQIKVTRDTTRKEPTVLACGVDRAVTGIHMSEWVLDDIMSTEAAENARTGSFTEIMKIKRWMNRLEPLCDGHDTPITLIGTPWWQGDCYDYAEELWGADAPIRRYRWVLKLPDGTTQQHILEVQNEMATFRRPILEGGRSIFPEKWPMDRIDRVRRADPQLFAANLMLNPSSDVVRDFKDDWLRDKYYTWTVPGKQLYYRDLEGEQRYVQVKELDCIMAVDPAISESAKADRTGIIVSGSLNGREHIILEAKAERVGVHDLCALVEELHKRYQCRRIYVETIQYQRALAQILAYKGLPIYESHPGTVKTKEMRIRTLEPYFRQGHVYFHSRMFEFFQEYEHFPRGQHDDLLDAMSYLTEEWGRLIGRQDKGRNAARQAVDEREIAKLRDWAYGDRRHN